MGWNSDMEAAPRDGTVILGGRTSSLTPWWIVYPMRQYWSDGRWLCADDGKHYEPEPTHWMPLPEPPKEDK